jgi:integrase
MRRGEICAITAADLDGNMLKINKSKVLDENNTWVIKPMPKTTDSQREIYIDDYVAELIRKNGDAFPDHPNRLNHHLHRLQKRLKLPAFRFHDLRAYYATLAHSMGFPDKYIMANGGWSSNRIMDRVYKRTFAEKQADANRMMAKKLGGSVGHDVGQN